LCGLDFPTNENVLVGLQRADDAGVYKISDEIALIQTVDFFTPIVDDPYSFGQIAAANALSDVYAMGGVPKTAMNLVGFPVKEMDISILRKILEGGLDKMKEADVVLVGGHSVEDKELKYGLSVTGFIHPDKVLTNGNLKPGDRLILTKPLGTGIINTAIKGGLASKELVDQVISFMAMLNRDAALAMDKYRVHACTDITGFGLLGHLAEMVVESEYSLEINAAEVPVFDKTVEFASMGIVPGGAHRNKKFREHLVKFSSSIDPVMQDVFFDPQTSGGLLISVDPEDAEALLSDLNSNNLPQAKIIGSVVNESEAKITVG
jgi:selenide, water dikinase